MKIPTISHTRVYRVGAISDVAVPARKGSLEGHCLSVSRCPHAWTQIAKLGGRPVFELRHDRAVFVDMLGLLADRPVVQAILDEQVSRGRCRRESWWRAWSQDEDEQWRWMVCQSRDEACVELDRDDGDVGVGEGPDGGALVEPVLVVVACEALAQKMGASLREDVTEFALMDWIEAQALPVVGFWWDEEHDPLALSAPRGGILPAAVASFDVVPVLPDDLDESALLADAGDPGFLGVGA